MAKLIAVRSNFLIEASYRLTLQEQRFMLCCIGKIDPYEPVPERLIVTSDEFYQTFPAMGIENKERELKKAVDQLWERSIVVKDPNQTEEFRWIQSRIKYHKGEARVSVKFADDIKKYLTQLSSRFTQVALNNVANLSTTYSIRIYELCQQFIKAGERTVELSELRDWLDCKDTYPEFKDFNKWVLKPSITELNKKSNLDIEIMTHKKGRRITSISFIFKQKKQGELDLELA
jgi:plasmid replication initiation protein